MSYQSGQNRMPRMYRTDDDAKEISSIITRTGGSIFFN